MADALALLHDVKAIVSRHQWLAQKHGLDFNVFDILRLTSNEVRGHSRFLAAILDPKGSHGLGCVFLDLFLKHLRSSGHLAARSLPAGTTSAKWTVTVEQPFNIRSATEGEAAVTGRIDLLLECGAVWLIIENKIYAGDQDRQLERYECYACSQTKNPVLVYLTLDGEAPGVETLGALAANRVIPVAYGGLIDR